MIRLLRLLAPILAIAGAASAHALPRNLDSHYAQFEASEEDFATVTSAAYQPCMDNSGAITARMRACYASESRRIDLLLNEAYRRTMARLAVADRERLRLSERRWITTRAAQCRRTAAAEQGSMALLVGDSCWLEETQRRTLWLRQLR